MKRIILLLVIFIVTFSASAQSIPKMKIDQLAKLIDTSTSPLIVNFWASWCAPCVQELPWFEKAAAEYKSKGLKLILVSLDFATDYPKVILDFAKKKGYTSPIIWLDETDADVFCPKIDKNWAGSIPATIFVNNKKKYRRFFGQQIPEPKLLQEIKLLLE